MHLGHSFRMAVPRYYSLDFPYSRGVPANFYLSGGFGYALTFESVAAGTWKAVTKSFDPVLAFWEYHFAFDTLSGFPFTAVIKDFLLLTRPGRQRTFLIEDGFGGQMSITKDYVPDFTTNWDDHDVTQDDSIFTVTGLFDAAFFWECRSLPYSGE